MKTIAWDVDDVLNDLMRSWLEQKWLVDRPECEIRYSDIAENPPHRILGCGMDEYLNSLDQYRLSGLYQNLEPVPEVMDWFVRKGGDFRHIVVTAVPLHAAQASAQWVYRSFGRWIRTFHVVPSPREGCVIPEYDASKADFLKWFGKADVFIDDNPLHVDTARAAGVKSILMPRPWNGHRAGVSRVLSLLDNL